MAGTEGRGRANSLGGFIKSQRRLAALSLRQLAAMTSVSNAYLSQIERGVHQPSLRVLRSLAQALDLPPDVLLEHAGIGPDETPSDADSSGRTRTAIQLDPGLTDADKRLLLDLYDRLRGD